MATRDQPGDGWTVVLRRRPGRMAEGRPEGGYTDAFEIICCDCGDHPDQDYSEVSPVLQQVRGPYLIANGTTHMWSTLVSTASRRGPPAWGRGRMLANRR